MQPRFIHSTKLFCFQTKLHPRLLLKKSDIDIADISEQRMKTSGQFVTTHLILLTSVKFLLNHVACI